MKIPDNSLASFIQFFKESLSDVFDKHELNAHIHEVFNYFFGLSRADLALYRNKTFTESEILTLFRVVKELRSGKPLAYILGHKEFYGLNLKVSPQVLIPRPETEELVDWIVKDHLKDSIRILDIGTGSGCIALALKHNLPSAEVSAVDFSEEALAIAKQNAKHFNLDVQFIKMDFLKDKLKGKYDIIVSNPPYITDKEKVSMHSNVLNFEPHSALFVHDDPLVFYRKLVQSAKMHLNPEGIMYWEINHYYSKDLIELLESNTFREIELRNDINGNPRMIKCKVPRES